MCTSEDAPQQRPRLVSASPIKRLLYGFVYAVFKMIAQSIEDISHYWKGNHILIDIKEIIPRIE